MTRKTIEIPVTHRHKPEDMRGIPVADEPVKSTMASPRSVTAKRWS